MNGCILRLERLSFGYGGRPLFSDLSLSLFKNEIICIIGTSGCGKTTLLNLAAGFISPDEGGVYSRGVAVEEPGPDRIMIFQDGGQLFPWLTAGANVRFADRGLSVAESDRLLAQAGLSGCGGLYPSQLSGGMRQRAALARALAGNPSVLLLDEPFSAVDAPTRRGLQDTLLSLRTAAGLSALFVTHDIREAVYLSDRVFVLTAGGGFVVENDLPHPRDRFSTGFVQFEKRLYSMLESPPVEGVSAEPAGVPLPADTR